MRLMLKAEFVAARPELKCLERALNLRKYAAL
jgi:hypothetical protein